MIIIMSYYLILTLFCVYNLQYLICFYMNCYQKVNSHIKFLFILGPQRLITHMLRGKLIYKYLF